TAAEQLLTKNAVDRENLIRLVMEGHLRGIVGQLAEEEIVKQPEMVADRMRATSADDMDKMGLEIVSFTIKEVRDQNEYIMNMGRPDIARIKREADIAGAEADRDTAIKRAQALRESAVAKAQAGQERGPAETAPATQQAEAERQRRTLESMGTAEADRQQGSGQADAAKAVGLAEADVIRAKGKAEADAMHLKADAFRQYNQAAVIDKFLTGLPEVARAM